MLLPELSLAHLSQRAKSLVEILNVSQCAQKSETFQDQRKDKLP